MLVWHCNVIVGLGMYLVLIGDIDIGMLCVQSKNE